MCSCGIMEPCYGCVCGCSHLTGTLLDLYQRGATLENIYKRGFGHGEKLSKREPQSNPVYELAQAILNGQVILNRHTDTGDFRIDVVNPVRGK